MDESTGIPDLGDAAEIMRAAGAMGEGGGKFLEGVDKVMGGRFVAHRAKQEQKAARSNRDFAIEMLQDAGVDISAERKLGITLLAMKEITGFENLEEVISRVAIPEGAEPEAIEDEWMARWVEGSKEAFSEWKRAIMADAARAKSVDPSSVSAAALDCISRMEGRDIDALRLVAGLCPAGDDDGWGPVLFPEDDLLLMVGLDLRAVRRLRDLGILHELPTEKRRGATVADWALHHDVGDSRICDGRNGGSASFVMDFLGVRVEATPVFYHQRLTVGVETDLFVTYGRSDLTEIGKDLASLVVPIPPDAGAMRSYLEEAFSRATDREIQRLESSQFSKREFERTVKEVLAHPTL